MQNERTKQVSRRRAAGAVAALIGATGAAKAQSGGPPVVVTGPNFFEVTRFGAVPDGKTKSTEALQRAIDACHGAGGGMVYIAPGVYLSGALRLMSNVVLHVDAGAVIRGSHDLADYTLPPIEPGGKPRRAGLLSAEGAQNITITGRGTIDGNGPVFVNTAKTRMPADFDRKYTRQKEAYMDPAKDTDGPFETTGRPGNLIRFTKCRNVHLSGVTIQNATSWTVHFIQCDDVSLSGVHINSYGTNLRMPNDDGLDISGCRNMRVTGCVIRTSDDCIAVFDTEGLVVSDCILESRSSAVRIGYGAHATDGNIRDCVFTNLTITGNRGICVNVRGPHSIDNVQFSNVTIRTRLYTGHWWGNGEPIHLSAAAHRNTKALGRIRNVQFSGISAESPHGIVIYGSGESVIGEVGFHNVRLTLTQDSLHESYGGNFDLREAADLREGIFEHDIPAVFARHVKGLILDGLAVEWRGELPPFFTHAVEVEHFRQLEITGFHGKQAPGTDKAVIALRNGEDVTIRDCRAEEGASTFLTHDRVTDQRLLANCDLSKAKEALNPPRSGFLLAGNRMPAAQRRPR